MSENKKPASNSFTLPNGMTLLEYLKSDAFKQRVRKAREEYQRKHPKGK